MTDFQQLLLEIRRHYKPLTKVAKEIGMNAKTLQRITQRGSKQMLYDNGVKIVELHRKHVPSKAE